MLEKELAFHCSPAFAGIKPSNLFSYRTDDIVSEKRTIKKLNSQLNGSGIFIKILCEYENRILIMVYRPNRLSAYLARPEISAFLKNCGYGRAAGVDDCIALLSQRIRHNREFPHEIGAFLGYPIEDIYGFINHKNSGCKYTGYWKVYSNVEAAKELFRKYDSCRNAVVRRLNTGRTLGDMFALAH